MHLMQIAEDFANFSGMQESDGLAVYVPDHCRNGSALRYAMQEFYPMPAGTEGKPVNLHLQYAQNGLCSP